MIVPASLDQYPQLNLMLQLALIDILPNPILVKDNELRYVMVNKAFEDLFSISRDNLIGKLDTDVFKTRQAVQCNSGDRRVLETGEIDEAFETVFTMDSEPRETITRKSRLPLPNGQVFLVGIMHDITEVSVINRQLKENQKLLQQQAEALEQMANTDPLTGCDNRRAFRLKAPGKFANHGYCGGLLLLDIDHFKQINDTYGHDVGDEVLSFFSKTIAQTLRMDEDLVRLGGEEFVIVLPGASVETSVARAEGVRKLVESTPLKQGDGSISITVSIGVVHNSCRQSFNLDKMLVQGDYCLYAAKKGGRNRVICADIPLPEKR